MTEQLDLLSWSAPASVIERCRTVHAYPGQRRNECVVFYAADMITIVGTGDCKSWCPLLKEAIT